MPFDSTAITVRRVDDEQWELVEPLLYTGRKDRFLVPEGFLTDFASVPRVIVWLIPRFGRYTLPAVLHDWLCRDGIRTGVVTSREADGLFRRSMRELGVPVLRRWMMWAGVRWSALTEADRRPGWAHSAPGVLAISLLALPLVAPPAVLIALALLVYGAAEWLAARVTSSPSTEAGSLKT